MCGFAWDVERMVNGNTLASSGELLVAVFVDVV